MTDTIRMGFGGPLFHIAREASENSVAGEHSSFVAILFSFFALEAWVNDLLDHVQSGDPHWSPLAVQSLMGFANELEGKGVSLELKIQLIAIGLAGRAFDRGRKPLQDSALLTRIRNALVHAKPEHIDIDANSPHRPHSILEQLEERGVLKLERVGVVNPLHGTLSNPEVGRWAFGTAVAMAEAVAEMLPASGLRTSTEMAFGKFPPEVVALLQRGRTG